MRDPDGTVEREEPDARPDPRRMFRLPWTAADNAMTWLEPTRKCNITCDACFAQNDPRSQKPLGRIEAELDAMLRLRRCDAMLVAGGEPLTHPDIAAVVRLVRRAGVKPVIVTNGVALDGALLAELKAAGVHGFTFHVDSHQQRPGWIGASEPELNALRSHLAGMVHEAGGLVCGFNTTVFPDALRHVPDVVAWALARPEQVQVLTLICVRGIAPGGPFRFVAGGREVDLGATPYASDVALGHLTAQDLYREIRRRLPDFEFCAFLGGTVLPDSLKWTVGLVLNSGRRSYGVAGARTMELIQTAHHFFRGRYLAYGPPRANRLGKLTLLLGVVDPVLRRTAARWLAAALRHPAEALRPLHLQSISVVQPVDILPNGEMDSCDGCPNRTYFEGRMVAACRLDEYQRYGAPVSAVPREREADWQRGTAESGRAEAERRALEGDPAS